MEENKLKNRLFSMVQDYLKPCPLIVWGSGATIPFGMPSMEELKRELNINEKGNLEDILSKVDCDKKRKEYEKKIFEVINSKDEDFRSRLNGKDPDFMKPVKNVENLISHFYKAHPCLLNIITTNYDCILEYIFSYFDYSSSDGFTGREFSGFNESRFGNKKHINLYKVHGSLRWSNSLCRDDKIYYSHYNNEMNAIFPGKNKYEKAHDEPFRTIIQKSDEAIKEAKCFLVIGFGFNDKHLTPKIDNKISINNSSFVIVTKKATDSLKKELNKAKKYILIEKGKNTNTSQFSFKEKNKEEKKELQDEYWKIEKFNTIFGEI